MGPLVEYMVDTSVTRDKLIWLLEDVHDCDFFSLAVMEILDIFLSSSKVEDDVFCKTFYAHCQEDTKRFLQSVYDVIYVHDLDLDIFESIRSWVSAVLRPPKALNHS